MDHTMAGERDGRGIGTRRLTHLAGFLLFLVLPILTPFGVALRQSMELERSRAEKLEENLDRQIRRRIFSSTPRERLAKAFGRLFNGLASGGFAIERTNLLFPGGIPWIPRDLGAQTAIFKPDDTLQVPPGGILDSRYVFARFWKDLKRGRMDPKNENLFKSLVGKRLFFWEFSGVQGVPIEIGPGNRDGFFIWRKHVKGGGMIVFIPRLSDMFLSLGLSLPRRGDHGVWGIFDPFRKRFRVHGGMRKVWQNVMERGVLQGGGSFIAEKYLCRIIRHPDGYWILRAVPMQPIMGTAGRTRMSLFALLALTLVSGIWLKTGWTPLVGRPLTPRLTIFFLMAFLVPGSLIIGLGAGSLREHASVLKEEAHNANLSRLRALDRRYGERNEALLAFFRRIRDLPSMHIASPARPINVALELMRKAFLSHLETRTYDNTLIGTHKGDPRLCDFVAYFSQEIFRRYLGKPLATPSTPLEGLIPDILASNKLGFATILEQPDSKITLFIGQETNDWYWDVRAPTASDPISFFMIAQTKSYDQDRFLERSLSSGTFAFDVARRRWLPNPPDISGALSLVGEAMVGRQAARDEMVRGDKSLFVTAYPSNGLRGYCFLNSCDTRPIRDEIAATKRVYGVAAFLALGLALLTARLVSGALLRPIEAMTRGIHALDQRRLEHRVPDLGTDEFGRLGIAFNEMMEEQQRLDVGRIVQRRILPATLPDITGYEVAYRCISMTELGGDYCDVLPRPDGKLLVVICDVTGHGISAALLTTMTKTVVATAARRGWSIGTLFDRLNAMVNQVVRKKKLMTIAALLLDPVTNSFEWSCAGHPAPCLRHADGIIENLMSPQYPIGARKKNTWQIASSRFDPGDVLVFYTDGIIEALNDSGEMFTYERFRDEVGNHAAGPAENTITRLLAANTSHIGMVPANDDLTLLVLRRLPGDQG
ncbi:MAG: SpoIIE family protein phosphatase [Candidatus Ozemobacteraceae bacterium]